MPMWTTTAKVYRFNPRSGSAVATDVPVSITGSYACGARETTPLLRPWTYTAEVPLATDVRDSYPGQAGSWLLGNADTLLLDSPADMAFVVIFVERIINAENDLVKRLYLDRLSGPPW
jgi:hypothetical protein